MQVLSARPVGEADQVAKQVAAGRHERRQFAREQAHWAALGVHAVIQGHAHGLERIYKDGLYFFTCAMGGGLLAPAAMAGAPQGVWPPTAAKPTT